MKKALITGTRVGWVAALLACLVVVAGMPGGSRAAQRISPGLFDTVSTGVAQIKTYGCGGRPLEQGSGFLVGTSVVMTARHVVQGACRISVYVNGTTYHATRWVSWYAAGTSVAAADVETIKLDQPVEGGYVFRVRSSLPPLGANLSAIGYPLGNRLSLNQGKLIGRLRYAGAPILAVRMLGAEGASGSAFLDDQGRVVGILQLGLGSRDVLGQRTSGVLLGLDLVRWWGPRARLDLCRAYPNGGIAGCPGAAPPPTTTTTPTPPPPPPPPSYHVANCWSQYTGGSWNTVNSSSATTSYSATDLLTRGPDNFWEIVQLDAPATAELDGVQVTLTEPNGVIFASTSEANWAAGSDAYAFSLGWKWADGTFFFQHPEISGQGTWRLQWAFPDGESCSDAITIN